MLTGWQSSKRICVAEHFEDEQQMSQCQVGEKTGKVVYLRIELTVFSKIMDLYKLFELLSSVFKLS